MQIMTLNWVRLAMTIQYLRFIHGLLTRMDTAEYGYFRDTILVISRLAEIIILAVRRLNISNTKGYIIYY